MIEIFFELIEKKILKIDIDNYIDNYTLNLQSLNKDYNYYYNLYSEINKKDINTPLNDEINFYKDNEINLRDFKDNEIEKIDSFLMKYCLLEALKNVIENKYKKDLKAIITR